IRKSECGYQVPSRIRSPAGEPAILPESRGQDAPKEGCKGKQAQPSPETRLCCHPPVKKPSKKNQPGAAGFFMVLFFCRCAPNLRRLERRDSEHREEESILPKS